MPYRLIPVLNTATKNTLRTGMRVVMDTGDDYLVIQNVRCGGTQIMKLGLLNLVNHGFLSSKYFTDDLETEVTHYKITEIWGPHNLDTLSTGMINAQTLAPLNDTEMRLYWRRPQ